MANIKVPVFGGLVTYADPEDLDDLYTPDTKNFDISKAGVLKRRESSTMFATLTDRGINSLYNWVHTKLSGGSQWLLYCNRRGIIYRMDSSLSSVQNDGFNGVTNMFGATYQYELDSPLPETISFLPLGDTILVNMGTEQDSYLFHQFDSKYFNALLQPGAGTYMDRFVSPYPDLGLTLTTDSLSGNLPTNDYIYNIAPVFDGVNEYPLSESIEKNINHTANSDTGKVTIDISLGMESQSKRLTNLKVYRSIDASATTKSYRQIKNINLKNFSTTDTGVTATGKMSRYYLYTDSTLPTQAEVRGKFNDKYNTSYSDSGTGDYQFGWMLFDTIDKATYDLDPDKYTIVTDNNRVAYIGGVDRYNNFDGNPSNMAIARTYSTHISANPTKFRTGINNLSSQLSFDYARQDDHLFRNIGVYKSYSVLADDYEPPAVEGSLNRGNGWTKKQNGDIVIAIVTWDYQNISWSGNNNVDGVRTNILKHEYIIVPRSYMGENHVYFPNNTLSGIDNLVGSDIDFSYVNYNNVTKTFSETIMSNTRHLLTISPTASDSISTDMIDASRRQSGNSVSTSNGYQGIMALQSVDVDVGGGVSYAYNTSTELATITLVDKGFIDGSLPVNPIDTKYNSRWKYAEQHGGRLFVANVVLDPNGENEKHPDMILFSEAGMFGMIPIGNYIRVRDPQGGEITGIKSLGDSLAVLMEFGVYRLRVPSINPSSFSIIESNEYEGCIAPNSVIKVSDSIYFCGTMNIYKIDGMFNVSPIGSVIEDKWREETDKKDSIAEYDPIKGCLIFRFGKTKHTLHEYNLERDEWNVIVMHKPVSTMGLGMTNHVYTIDNTSLTATREDNSHYSSEPDPTDDPSDSGSGVNHVATANGQETTGDYWSSIIGVGQTWGSNISDDPIIAEDFGEEDVVIPPTGAGDGATITTYRKFKIYKLATTTSFRFGNWSDGTQVYLPVKNEDNPIGVRYTWFYWNVSVGEPVTNIAGGYPAVDALDPNQHENHALVSLGLTNASVVKDSNGVYFYNGERDIVTAENSGNETSVPEDTFHDASVIFPALKQACKDKWHNESNAYRNFRVPSSGGNQPQNSLKYEVTPDAFKVANGVPLNDDYQNGWVIKEAIASNYMFLLPEVDSNVIPWISESMVSFFESNNINYTQPLITGKLYQPIWFDGGYANIDTISANETAFSQIQWSEIEASYILNDDGSYSDRNLRAGIPMQLMENYTTGSFNEWINDESLSFWEKLIIVKTNSATTKGYFQQGYPNPFSPSVPRHYLIWYNIMRGQRLKDVTWT